jgi:hypothetical protein
VSVSGKHVAPGEEHVPFAVRSQRFAVVFGASVAAAVMDWQVPAIPGPDRSSTLEYAAVMSEETVQTASVTEKVVVAPPQTASEADKSWIETELGHVGGVAVAQVHTQP